MINKFLFYFVIICIFSYTLTYNLHGGNRLMNYSQVAPGYDYFNARWDFEKFY